MREAGEVVGREWIGGRGERDREGGREGEKEMEGTLMRDTIASSFAASRGRIVDYCVLSRRDRLDWLHLNRRPSQEPGKG